MYIYKIYIYIYIKRQTIIDRWIDYTHKLRHGNIKLN